MIDLSMNPFPPKLVWEDQHHPKCPMQRTGHSERLWDCHCGPLREEERTMGYIDVAVPDKEEQQRLEFEAWLWKVHMLDDEWDSQRRCYKEFACHLAYQSWKAAKNGY
jgi:hypothetical protein